MLEEYFNYEIRSVFTEIISKDDDYVADYAEFNVVDGEEGDYGVITYLHDNEVVAIRTIFGGDDERIKFTDFGKSLFNAKLQKALSLAMHGEVVYD